MDPVSELPVPVLLFSQLEREYEYFKDVYDEIKEEIIITIQAKDNEIIYEAISLLESPEIIAGELSKSPQKIFHEPRYQVAIWFLRSLCEREQSTIHKWAKKLLRDMGLTIFIPKRPKRITDHPYLYYYKQNPEQLKLAVQKYRTKILEKIDLHRPLDDKENKAKIIELFETIFDKKPPNDLLTSERLLKKNTIALAFLSFEIDAPFESLKKQYYKA